VWQRQTAEGLVPGGTRVHADCEHTSVYTRPSVCVCARGTRSEGDENCTRRTSSSSNYGRLFTGNVCGTNRERESDWDDNRRNNNGSYAKFIRGGRSVRTPAATKLYNRTNPRVKRRRRSVSRSVARLKGNARRPCCPVRRRDVCNAFRRYLICRRRD